MQMLVGGENLIRAFVGCWMIVCDTHAWRLYPSFVSVVDQFVEYFGLVTLSRKDLDKFLWIEGKDNWR